MQCAPLRGEQLKGHGLSCCGDAVVMLQWCCGGAAQGVGLRRVTFGQMFPTDEDVCSGYPTSPGWKWPQKRSVLPRCTLGLETTFAMNLQNHLHLLFFISWLIRYLWQVGFVQHALHKISLFWAIRTIKKPNHYHVLNTEKHGNKARVELDAKMGCTDLFVPGCWGIHCFWINLQFVPPVRGRKGPWQFCLRLPAGHPPPLPVSCLAWMSWWALVPYQFPRQFLRHFNSI